MNENGHRKLNHLTYSFEFLEDFKPLSKNVRSYITEAMVQIGLLQSGSYNQRSVTVDSGTYMLMPTGKNASTRTRSRDSQQKGKDDWMIEEYDIKNNVLNLMVSRRFACKYISHITSNLYVVNMFLPLGTT